MSVCEAEPPYGRGQRIELVAAVGIEAEVEIVLRRIPGVPTDGGRRAEADGTLVEEIVVAERRADDGDPVSETALVVEGTTEEDVVGIVFVDRDRGAVGRFVSDVLGTGGRCDQRKAGCGCQGRGRGKDPSLQFSSPKMLSEPMIAYRMQLARSLIGADKCSEIRQNSTGRCDCDTSPSVSRRTGRCSDAREIVGDGARGEASDAAHASDDRSGTVRCRRDDRGTSGPNRARHDR